MAIVAGGCAGAQSLPSGADFDIPADFGGPQIDTGAANDGAQVVCDPSIQVLRVLSYSASTSQIQERQITELLSSVFNPFAGSFAAVPLTCAGLAPNASGKGSQLLAAGDFNGDGISDAAVANAGSATVAIYLGNTDGTFRGPVNYSTAASPVAVVAGDWNGDGILDLAVAASGTSSSSPGSISVLLGNGDGTFHPAVNYLVGSAPQALAWGDFNGDGKPDLAVANSGSNNVSVLLGDGDGTFKPPVNYAAGSAPSSIVAADFNGDGKPDLATANNNSNDVSILMGNGDGTFQAPKNSGAPIAPTFLAYGDFNQDGKLDLAVVSGETSSVSILAGDGNGGFAPPVPYLAASTPAGLQPIDLNADGHLDLMVNGTSDFLSVMFGAGDGSLFAPPIYPLAASPQSIAVGDFNGDGRPDLVTANTLAAGVSTFLGNGNGSFLPALEYLLNVLAPNASPSALLPGDFNQDGKTDLAITDNALNLVWILLGNGDGTFDSGKSYPVGSSPQSLALGDFNGDGRIDLAIADNGSSSSTPDMGDVSILLGTGQGNFQSALHYAAGSHPIFIAAADFNGDGKLDLAVANNGDFGSSTPGGVSILIGNGDGTFRAAVNYAVGPFPRAVAVGDFNRDGKLDLAVAIADASFSSFSIGIMTGNGDGTFLWRTSYPTAFDPQFIATADLNDDGITDLVVAHCCGSTDMTYLIGNPDGTFQPEVHFPGGASPVSVAVADFNGDGKPDLAVADSAQGTPGAVAILLNQAPPFTNLATVSAASFELGPVASESIVSAFGTRLATTTATARSLPLPEVLSGTTVIVRDQTGTGRAAPLFFVSPGQVNFEIPAGTATGLATVTIVSGDGSLSSEGVQIAAVTPGLFEVNSAGLAAANIVRVQPGNIQTTEAVATLDPVTNQIVAVPIDLGNSTDQVYLILYGTGIRGRSSAAAVSVTIHGVSANVSYSGPQGTFAGLDQVNLLVPYSLKGAGDVDVTLTADGIAANTVRITIK